MKRRMLLFVVIMATLTMVSCKKDYQKLATEYIRNLPDSCEFLVQVENEAEHLVYYKTKRLDAFFCYNVENGNTETIPLPEVDGVVEKVTARHIGAGKENIIVGFFEGDEMSYDKFVASASIQLYNLKTQTFKDFVRCNIFWFDDGTKQVTCETYMTDRYGDGTRTEEKYDFDGNLLTSKEVEVSNYEDMQRGAQTAKGQGASAEIDKELDNLQGIIGTATDLMRDGWGPYSTLGGQVSEAYEVSIKTLRRLESRGFTDQQTQRYHNLCNKADQVFRQWESQGDGY